MVGKMEETGAMPQLTSRYPRLTVISEYQPARETPGAASATGIVGDVAVGTLPPLLQPASYHADNRRSRARNAAPTARSGPAAHQGSRRPGSGGSAPRACAAPGYPSS